MHAPTATDAITHSTYNVRKLGDVCGGDHVCYLCQSDEEKWKVLGEFYRVGIERNEKMMFFQHNDSEENVLHLLEEAGGVELREFVKTGQFTIKHYHDVYFKDGEFTPENMVGLLSEETNKCLVEGYSGLRICGDMSWVHKESDITSKLLRYESMLNRGFPDNYAALCLYDTRVFKPQDMLQVLSTHPQAIINKRLLQNIYYMPPDEYLGLDVNKAMLDRWMHNIEERMNVEEQLIASKLDAERSANAKSSFLATMSHEIRNPTNGIIGSADLLAQTRITEEQKDYVNIIQASAKHLYRVVNDVLDFSKIESGRMEFAKSPIKLKELLEDSLQLCQFSIQKNLAVSLRCFAELTCPEIIIGDETRLRQILVNLIGNACKFTDEGEVVVSVVLVNQKKNEKDVNNQMLEFSVKDSGIGISNKDQAQLFQKFTQLDVGRKWAGTGLGLSICKQLVEAMGGQIFVKSQVGLGSTFYFRIPVILPLDSPSFNPVALSPHYLRSASPTLTLFDNESSLPSPPLTSSLPLPISPHTDHIDLIKSSKSAPASLSSPSLLSVSDSIRLSSPPPSHFDFSGDHILLVEDDITNQKVMANMLRKLKCKVTIASNGNEAIRLANENDYSLILTDQYMPECDGYAAMKQIRENYKKKLKLNNSNNDNNNNKETKCPTLVACTGTYEPRLQEVMDDYIIKPIRLKTMSELLARHCNNKV